MVRFPRFHHPGPLTGTGLVIEGYEAHHAAASRRLRRGADLEIFDGRGGARKAVVVDAAPSRIEVRFSAPIENDPPPARTLVLCLSPPRGERMRFAVEKLSELGCTEVVPLLFRRSLDAGVRAATGKMDKWRRTAVEAAKQCGRNRVIRVARPVALSDALSRFEKCEMKIALDLHDNEAPLREMVEHDRAARTAAFLVGPEGGITTEERGQISASGFRTARLFDYTLRIETAAVAAAAVWRSTFP